jgi:hypothetical protein
MLAGYLAGQECSGDSFSVDDSEVHGVVFLILLIWANFLCGLGLAVKLMAATQNLLRHIQLAALDTDPLLQSVADLHLRP